jgi:RNA polymerase sporulation-specific sigma factor
MFSVAVLMAKFLADPFIFLLSYVTNGNSFPKPLTDEEEKYYLGQYKNNDINARNILIERNLRLVAHVVKKFNTQLTGTETDDLISIGTIGLIKAITTFNPDKGTKLATYAARCIENEILMTMRSSRKLKNEVSLNEAIGVDKEGNEITFLDIVREEDDEVIDKVDLKLRIKVLCTKMKSLLKDREKLILKMRYAVWYV